MEVTPIEWKDGDTVCDSTDEGALLGKREALVYVDLKRTEVAEPRHEYIVRMNRGIKEAMDRLHI